jgi:hypothetical protein
LLGFELTGFSPASAPVGYLSKVLTTATSIFGFGFAPGFLGALSPISAPPSGLAERINPSHLLQEAPAYPTGLSPISIAIGDFNGDGKEDLVTANYFGNNISVLLGNGDGTFAAPVNYATQYVPSSVAVGDFNGDGKLDIAVTNLCGGDKTCGKKGTVSILLGNGDGTFQPHMDFEVGGYHPASMAVGDFNGDKKLDLAIANACGENPTCESGPFNVAILLGNGDGTFQKPTKFATGTFPQSVAVADFNGDGKLDLAVANYGGTVSILLGNGDGTFRRHVDYAAGAPAYSVAVGDFNGDGNADLAVADEGIESNAVVSVLLGNGDGTFQPLVSYPTGNEPLSVAVADLNHDGKQDLVLANYFGNSVSVLLGNGDGTFQLRSDYGMQSGPSAVLVGSFHGSGCEDVVATNINANTVSVLLDNGTGTFPTRQDFATALAPWSLATGDFNRDGKPDIVATAFPIGNFVSVLLANGNGTFQPHVDYATGLYPYAVVVGDFNDDGKQDLATANEQGSSVSILLGNGDGTFQTHVDFPAGVNPSSIAAGDFRKDGKLDLVTTNLGPRIGASTITVLLGNGDGTFQPPVPYSTGILPYSVSVGDFNGDHKLDLAVANYCGSDPHCQSGGSVSIFLGNGDGTFQPQVQYSTEKNPESVAIADFNHDGKLDLAVANVQSNTVSILLGNGDGTFQPEISYATGVAPYSLAVGDFNGDGNLHVVTANCEASNCATPADGGTVSMLLGNGDGTFQPHVDFAVGSEPHSIAVADFNGDGKPDLATTNNQSYTVSVLLNTTGTTVTLTSSPIHPGRDNR